MDNNRWQKLLRENTAEYGPISSGTIEECPHKKITFDFFKSLGIDKKGKVLLDVGSGFADLSKNVESLCVPTDIITSQIGKVLLADAHELPFADDSFDIIYCNHVLEHTLSPLICLIEMKRVCKPDGHIVIGVPVHPGFYSDCHNYVLTEQGWALLISRVGLNIMQESKIQSDCKCYYCYSDNKKKVPK